MKLPVLPQDKANHVIYGAAIASVAAAVLSAVLTSTLAVGLLTLAVSALAGSAKELMDSKTEGAHVELEDAYATVVGGAIVALPLMVRHVFN